jgi:hypothetical protein
MSLPLAARAPISAALGRDEPGYDVLGLDARNPAQRLTAAFSRDGVTVASGKTHVHLALLGYGHGSAFQRVGPVSAEVRANRVAYRHAGVIEWYANGPLGLEQGFDVASAPTTGRGPLTVSLALTGDIRARLGQAGALLEGPGVTLRYGGLEVSDARGRTLHSWLELRRGRLLIRVEDRAAVYPLRIDPFLQQAELTASDGGAGDSLGAPVAIAGNTIVAGAYRHQVGANTEQGAVYVFTMPPSGWANATQTAELTASDGGAGDDLGVTLAIAGNTIVAGAPFHEVGGSAKQGAAYVFTMPCSGWKNATQTARLTASDGVTKDELGSAVAIAGNTIVAGAPLRKVGSNNAQGMAYVFTMPVSGWKDATQTAELTVEGGAAGEVLGLAVAISGNTIVACAPFAASNMGAVYVFTMPAAGWENETQTAKLTASDGVTGDQLGFAVAIASNTIVAGAAAHKVGGNNAQGVAYVFTMPAAGWKNATQTAELTASDGATNDRLSVAVAIAGNTIVAGALGHKVGANAFQGAVYIFTMPASGWENETQTTELTASDGAEADRLGAGVAIAGDTIVAGAFGRMVGGNATQGAAYAFVMPPSVAIATPASGASYTQGQIVAASYSCTVSSLASLTACAGPVASGAAIDTSTLGQHSFTVNAIDNGNAKAGETVSYSVVPGPAPPASPRVTGAVPPTITAAHQSHSTWRAGAKLAQVSAKQKKPPVGTTFSFSLNEKATVSFSFTQRVGGRKVKGKCVAQNNKNRRKGACRRIVTAASLSFTGHSATNKVLFQGAVSRSKKLAPGRYTLVITATNATGQKSTPQSLSFTIVK